jgi:hypothetical protein
MEPKVVGSRKDAVVVLGMHRSGTSAMARTLSLAGADLPTNLMGPGVANPKGHWEPADVQVFNDKILEELDSSWDDLFGPRRGPKWRLAADRFVPAAVDIIRSNWSDSTTIVFKEPRTAILLDVWLAALGSEGYRTSFVIMVRNPIEVAASLRARDKISKNSSLVLWSTYMLASEVGTREHPRVFVNYDDLLDDPEVVLDRIESTLDLNLPRRTWESASDIEEFLDRQERHQLAAGGIGLKGFQPVDRYYKFLEGAANGAPWNVDISTELSDWLNSLTQTLGPVVKRLERDLRASRNQIQADRDQLSALATAHTAKTAELERMIDQARVEAEEANQARQRASSELDSEAERRAINAQKALESLEERSARELGSLRQQLSEAATTVERAQSELDLAKAERAVVEAERAQELAALSGQLERLTTDAEMARNAAERKLNDLSQNLEQARSEAASANEAADLAKSDLAGLAERLELATSQASAASEAAQIAEATARDEAAVAKSALSASKRRTSEIETALIAAELRQAGREAVLREQLIDLAHAARAADAKHHDQLSELKSTLQEADQRTKALEEALSHAVTQHEKREAALSAQLELAKDRFSDEAQGKIVALETLLLARERQTHRDVLKLMRLEAAGEAARRKVAELEAAFSADRAHQPARGAQTTLTGAPGDQHYVEELKAVRAQSVALARALAEVVDTRRTLNQLSFGELSVAALRRLIPRRMRLRSSVQISDNG